MKANEAIETILIESNRSKRSLALDLGITPQALDIRMKSKSMKVNTFCETVHKLGYRVELIPIDACRRKFQIES